MVHDRVDRRQHGLLAVFLDELQESALAGLDRSDLRPQVADGAIRDPHVHANDLEQFLVQFAGAIHLHDRHLQAFGIDIRRDPAERAADVLPMRHAGRKSDQFVAGEDRHRERHVIEVAAGGVGVVGEQHVARLDAVDPEMPQLRLHGLAHAANEHRQAEADRDRVAGGVEQADREVERLVDDHVVGGAHQVRLHLFGDADERVAHDFSDDRIGRRGPLRRRV